jgi:serine/threonine protein kinase
MTLAAGVRLGPYEVVAPLGSGGMGEVYRARDRRLEREVALKIVAGGTTDAGRVARFTQEACAAAALNHPHILAVYDVGTAAVDGIETPYVVMELLQGETLRERVSRGPLPARLATELAIQIARGLAAAHDQGIVHRDVKPENVYVTTDGTAKLLDFGLAKLRDTAPISGDGSTTAGVAVGTGPGVVLGTVGYMAPEQVRGQAVDHRADLFALGAVLYELVTGQRAFSGTSAADTLSAILNHEPADLSADAAGVSGGLERVVRRCLAKAPEQRFQSARDLAFALDAVSDLPSGREVSAPDGSRAQPRRWREAVAWAVAAAVAVGWGATARRASGTDPVPAPVVHATLSLPADARYGGSLAYHPKAMWWRWSSSKTASPRSGSARPTVRTPHRSMARAAPASRSGLPMAGRSRSSLAGACAGCPLREGRPWTSARSSACLAAGVGAPTA